MSCRLAALVGFLLAAALVPHPASAQAQKPPAAAAKPTPKPAAPPPAKPQDAMISPSHMALAREAMQNSGLARSFDSIIPTFAEQIKKNAVTRPELAKDLEEALKGLGPEMELQKQRMVDIAAKIYAQRFTEAELQDIVTFFRSPSGKKYVETQPQLLDELVGAMQDWTQDVSEYMMVRVRAEMGKRGHDMQ